MVMTPRSSSSRVDSRVHVTRYSFFDAPAAAHSQRFVETTLDSAPQSRCGCTEEITARPDGDPTSSHCVIGETGSVGEYRLEANYTYPDPRIVLLQGPPRDDPAQDWKSPHASFSFRPGGLDVYISFGDFDVRVGSGSKLFDYGANLKVGVEIDFSRLRNGHMPSEIVMPEMFGPGDLWVYDCNGGREAMARFPVAAADEESRWREMHTSVMRLQQIGRELEDGRPVAEILQAFETHEEATALRRSVISWAQEVAEEPAKIQLFILGELVAKEVEDPAHE